MFRLKRPCANCPFRRSMAKNFRLCPERLEEIRTASAFQCHKTVDYSGSEGGEGKPGEKPQQCAGLMRVLHEEGQPNQIMQVAKRLIGYDPSKIEAEDTFDSWDDVKKAHRGEGP